MTNNASTPNYYEDLKKSVTFNMSLSSKELFHSNFLAWLADIDPARFLKVLQSLGINTDGLDDGHYYPWCLDNISQEYSLEQPKTQENESLPNYWIVRREYKNFDICVIDQLNPYYKDVNPVDLNEGDYIGGRIRVVIENKVKSIPYEDQLSSYTKKVKEYNSKWFRTTCKDSCKKINRDNKGKENKERRKELIGEDSIKNTMFLLLSLAKSFPQRDTIEKPSSHWIVKSYNDYHGALSCFQDHKDTQIKNIIEDYRNFISALHKLSQRWVNEDEFLYFEIENNTRKYSDNYKNCKALRIHDLYHKLRFSAICSSLINTMEKIHPVSTTRITEYTGTEKKLYAGIEFLHGEPLIELHVYIPNNSFLYVIQSQGGVYQHGIISKGKSYDVWNNLINGESEYNIKDGWMNIKKAPELDNDVLKRNSKYDENVIQELNNQPLQPDANKIINRNGREPYSGYHKYDMNGSSYVYQARQIPNGTKINDIIDMMVKDCQSLLSQNP